jgi:membrane protease subunit (stomatin/prohibitin family)
MVDASAEEGDYIFDESVQPSFFAGNFGAVFKQMWQRFTFGGATADQQAVYYFNMKEIMDNKFGTATPIPYQDWSHPIPNQMTGGMLPLSVKVKCYGNYTFKISDPSLFMHEIAGTAAIYKKDQLIEQMRSEVISVFQNVVNELGTEKYKVPVLELPSQTDEIKEIMDEKIFDEPIRKRGLTIVVFAVMSVTLDEESDEYIKKYNLSANANMQQGTLVEAYSEAVKGAAKNSNGAANGFLGVGMMNMAGNGIFGGAINNANTQAAQNVQNFANQNGIPKNGRLEMSKMW